MVKHSQTIRRQNPTNCLSVFDYFVGLALKGLNTKKDFNYFHKNQNLTGFWLGLFMYYILPTDSIPRSFCVVFTLSKQ